MISLHHLAVGKLFYGKKTMSTLSYLGFGLGLRPPHYQTIIDTKPAVDWFEIVSEDYLVPGGKPHYYLDQIRQDYPMVMHGVSLSIGGCDPLDMDYLTQLRDLAQRIEPEWVSDHVCWTGINGINLHDLMPMPYTQEALDHMVDRVDQVQSFLGRPLVLENPSSYLSFKQDQMTEWDFFNQLMERAGCYMLFDVNNVYVSGFNHGFDPQDYLNNINRERVVQFHLAGHTHKETHIIDTHDEDIIVQVWDLYEDAVKRFGKVSTMIERDDNIPPFTELFTELQQAKKIADQVLCEQVA